MRPSSSAFLVSNSAWLIPSVLFPTPAKVLLKAIELVEDRSTKEAFDPKLALQQARAADQAKGGLLRGVLGGLKRR